MFISTWNYLSMIQLRRVMQDTGCSARQALSRTRTAIRLGIDVRYFIAQELAQGIRRKYRYSVRETYINRLYLLSDEEIAAQTVKACGGSFDDAVDKLVRDDTDKERVGHREQTALPSVLQNDSFQWLKRRNEEPVFS